MRPLVDGHNAMYALGIEHGKHENRRRYLLDRVRAIEPRATVFFDARNAPAGLPPVASESGLRVVYCQEREADHEIIDTVRDADEPREFLVVSNDREVTGRCRQLGARTESIAEFFDRPERRTMTTTGPAPRVPSEIPAARPLTPLRDGDGELTPADFDLPDELDLR